MVTILGWSRGPVDPRFDAVFNKTASLTESLYARARIGVTGLDSKYPKWTPFGPLSDTPCPTS